ncbi:hypothetical protein NPIL_622711 [Nephila pilipes]|uniref:Uncharacterized protein n=1 Tax=Nephila pilipes TaxID=299642 RepID=A0A8X6P7B9_NEPPI|nr:hypothetical protein NPIL_622711 [Nephila pilipes]
MKIQGRLTSDNNFELGSKTSFIYSGRIQQSGKQTKQIHDDPTDDRAKVEDDLTKWIFDIERSNGIGLESICSILESQSSSTPKNENRD